MEEKGMPKIRCIEDLKDERAREIAHRYNLDMKEILPDYLELITKAMRDGNRLVFPKHKEAPLNIYQDCIRRLASGMVICYELTKRDRIKTNFVIKRRRSIEDCETIGYNLQQYINLFEKRQREKTSKLVNGEK